MVPFLTNVPISNVEINLKYFKVPCTSASKMSYKGVFDQLFSNISLKIKSLVHKSWQKPQHLRFFCTKVSACERRLQRSSDVETRMSMDYVEQPLFYSA